MWVERDDMAEMSALAELRRLERGMTYVRWFAVVFALVAVWIRSDYPSETTELAAWILVAILALGNLLVWAAIPRVSTKPAQRRLGFAAFVLDAAVVMGLVWVFAHEDPYVTWALLLVLPMEGALRYRLKGALAAAAVVVVFFVAQTLRVAALNGDGFDLATFIFVSCLALLVAGVTGTMAENWHAQSMAVEQQSSRLHEADRLKDRFLAVTSHEIRGPLTAIIAGIDMVRKRGDRLGAERRDELLEMVAQQGRQLGRLVDDLLVTSQLQTGTLKLHEDWCDLEATIRQALDAAAAKRRSHQVELFIEPLRCRIDSSRVVQIVRNLVENAYKYTPDRTRVAITGKQADDGIFLEVADDGEGIPPDKRHALFEAFSRIEETTAGREGVGLGLYVVSHLVAAMQGRIDLASSSKGTSFSIYIPCEKAPLAHPELDVVRGEGAGG